jgi:hypothetical protein
MRELGRAYRTSTLTAMDRSRVDEYYRTLDVLARERKVLQARAEEIATLQAEATRARAALDKALAARERAGEGRSTNGATSTRSS